MAAAPPFPGTSKRSHHAVAHARRRCRDGSAHARQQVSASFEKWCSRGRGVVNIERTYHCRSRNVAKNARAPGCRAETTIQISPDSLCCSVSRPRAPGRVRRRPALVMGVPGLRPHHLDMGLQVRSARRRALRACSLTLGAGVLVLCVLHSARARARARAHARARATRARVWPLSETRPSRVI